MTIVLMKQIIINHHKKYNEEKLKSRTILNKNNSAEIVMEYYVNENTVISGIYTELLDKIFNSLITPNILKKFLSAYINIQRNEQHRSFERKSKRPFTKWYVKKYHELYKLKLNDINIKIKKLVTGKDENAIIVKKEYKKLKNDLVKKYREDMQEISNCTLK